MNTTMDTETRRLLEAMNRQPAVDFSQLPIEALRQAMTMPQGKVEAVGRVWEETIAGGDGQPLRLRLYAPEAAAATRPAMLFLHGGGFVLCDLDSHDNICRALCNAAGALVVSVAYRLAPEHPFPAAPEDAYSAFQWLASQAVELDVDANNIAVAGDSAGGNLAVATSLLCRDRGGPQPAQQCLLYPAIDAACDSDSMHEFAEGYLLSREQMRWFWAQYLPASQRQSPYAQPLRAELAGLPPTTLITAGCDPLRDEGQAFAEALARAGNTVAYHCEAGQIHGFCSYLQGLPAARRVLEQVAASLGKA